MRAIILLILIVTAIPCLAQTPDSVFHSIGIFVDYDGTITDHVGIKYRFSESWSCFLRAYYDNFDDEPISATTTEYDHLSYDIALGAEWTFLTIDKLSLFAYGNFGYSYSKTIQHYLAAPTSTPVTRRETFTANQLSAGLGVEYFISPQFTLAIRQSGSVSFSSINEDDPIYPNDNSTGQSTRLGTAFITITYYF
jgi:hypothetical protein